MINLKKRDSRKQARSLKMQDENINNYNQEYDGPVSTYAYSGELSSSSNMKSSIRESEPQNHLLCQKSDQITCLTAKEPNSKYQSLTNNGESTYYVDDPDSNCQYTDTSALKDSSSFSGTNIYENQKYSNAVNSESVTNSETYYQ